jgi:DNA-binding transcriptional ArsR family regulator
MTSLLALLTISQTLSTISYDLYVRRNIKKGSLTTLSVITPLQVYERKTTCMPKDSDSIVTDAPPRPLDMRRRRRHPVIQIVASPAYDLLLSIHVAFCSPRVCDYEIDNNWIERARAACPPELLATLTYFFGSEEGQWCAANLFALLWRAPQLDDTLGTIEWLASQPIEDIILILFERDGLGDDWHEIARNLIRARLTIKPGRKNDLTPRIQAFARRFPTMEREAVVRFLTEPEQEHARLMDAIRDWYQYVFAVEEPRVATALKREAATIERRAGELSAEELFTNTVRGIEYKPPACVERIVLAPSIMIMPSIFYLHVDDTITYCYPIPNTERSASDIETAQRREMVRLFDALADDTRIRILRLLSQRQMYLTELADNLKLTKATTRHHMIRLRAAGLVTLHTRDHLSYYSLRRETLEEPTRSLLNYLGLAPQMMEQKNRS